MRDRSTGPGAGASDARGRGVLVIGYGNSLRADDGAGPRVAELLEADPRLGGAVIVAVHQLSPELADDLRSAGLVVLVDATTDAAPGAVVVRPVEAWVEPRASASAGAGAGVGSGAGAGTGGGPGAGAGAAGSPGATSHHVDPGVLLALARELYGATPEAHVVSIGVADLEAGEELSPAVAAALPAAVEAVVALVAARGTTGAA